MDTKLDLKSMTIITASVGVIIFLFNYFFIEFNFFNLIAVILVLVGPAIYEYIKYKENMEIEENFPDFLKDVSENIKSGMNLSQAIKKTKGNDYGALSKYVNKIVVKLDWGVSLDEVLLEFSKNKNPAVRRTVSSILEIYKGGGNVKKVFETIADSIIEINKIRAERYSAIYSQMLTGYVVFFVFLGVLVSLQKYLIPSFSVTGADPKFYSDLFGKMILIQGLFSGLIIGKMSEGKIIAGLKHCLILMVVGYGVLSFFA